MTVHAERRGGRERLATALLVAFGLVWFTGGCRSEACQRMVACCGQLKGRKEVGRICSKRADQVRDAETCRTILKTVRYMYEDRGESPPSVCLSDNSRSDDPDES
ncbi:MAG: hypothetical protein ABEL76_03040 [Bradymonadaceae bacterium]